MARTPTKTIPLGFDAPGFELPEPLTGKHVKLGDVKGEKGTLVMFICNHCPFVIHVIDELVNIGNEYMEKGIGIVAINSNDVVNYPDDHPDKMKELARKKEFPFPYLFDESQEVARAYEAACTPDFNLFDAEGNQTEEFKRSIEFLQNYQNQHESTRELVKLLTEYEVFKDVSANITLPAGEKIGFGNLLMVDEMGVLNLEDEKLLNLVRTGYLAWIYAHLYSLSNFRSLMQMAS